MALFNKLFHSRRKNYNKYQDNVCDKLFTFTNDQVRVVLFRECDFRGRKLLFDSQTVQKVPFVGQSGEQDPNNTSNYAEVSNGHKYIYTKPNADVTQLGEMIFGSVAMSYRGTSYKIHSLTLPQRLMCTQVFPSPKHSGKVGRNSAPSRSCMTNSTGFSSQSLEHSFRLDDSSTSCTTSVSDQSLHSTASDTLLVCRRNHSVPLDVPRTSAGVPPNIPNSSVVGDSGFCGGQSCSSTGSGPHSFPMWDADKCGNLTFSCSSLYKRWLRSASTSLEYSTSSLPASASADECFARVHPRTSKLGLAIVIELSSGQEEKLEQFLMDHAALIESMVWRVRQGAEVAYIRHNCFISLMCEVAVNTAQWLVDFFSGPKLKQHVWLTLSINCDSMYSINLNKSIYVKNARFDESDSELPRTTSIINLDSSNSGSFKSDATSSCELNCSLDKGSEFTFLNITKFFKSDSKKAFNGVDNVVAEKFVRELCELLESVDVKHTNFFISTLITAVLTHHLGWTATALTPSQDDEEVLSKLQKTGNPLWGQLNDLYGAVGHPTKTAYTVVTGSNKSELIVKILNALTYFIRCNHVERKCVSRMNADLENAEVDRICHENRCIPKENYKRYEDHLKEIAVVNESCKKNESNRNVLPNTNSTSRKQRNLSSNKTYTCLSSLSKEDNVNEVHTNDVDESNGFASENKSYFHKNVEKMTGGGLEGTRSSLHDFSNDGIANKVRTLSRVPKSAVLCHMDDSDSRNILIDENEPEKHVKNLEYNELRDNTLEYPKLEENCKTGVIFLLGDDDELVGIKKGNHKSQISVDRSKELNSGLRRNKKFIMDLASQVLHEDTDASDLCKSNQHTSTQNISHNQKFYFKPFDSPQENDFASSEFKDSDFVEYEGARPVQPSTSWSQLQILASKNKKSPNFNTAATSSALQPREKQAEKSFTRSKSEPPEDVKMNGELKATPRFRYAGVKFNFQQHTQIFKNYMRSKNIELSNLTFAEKAVKFQNGLSATFDFSDFQRDEELEALQTPSNASELDFTSELFVEKTETEQAKEVLSQPIKFVRDVAPNAVVVEPAMKRLSLEKISNANKVVVNDGKLKKKIKLVELPMPKTKTFTPDFLPLEYTCSLFRGVSERYISDMVLQGTTAPKSSWEASLRKDLCVAARHPLLDQPVEEAVAIVANTDTWEVQLMSSHTYVIDKGSSGVRVGMSQIVANMLESLLHMWKLHAPPEHCLMHIEQRLQEFCLQSKALAELLLATDFCSMELLTSSLQLEVNDVPLLMAVASTHSPLITQKYGLSFQ